ncbi:hypothetical protein LXL04_006798 [Taraxacum kok-saghyz]
MHATYPSATFFSISYKVSSGFLHLCGFLSPPVRSCSHRALIWYKEETRSEAEGAVRAVPGDARPSLSTVSCLQSGERSNGRKELTSSVHLLLVGIGGVSRPSLREVVCTRAKSDAGEELRRQQEESDCVTAFSSRVTLFHHLCDSFLFAFDPCCILLAKTPLMTALVAVTGDCRRPPPPTLLFSC